MLAACSWPTCRDVRTADPSADGRRSAASRTAIGGGHIVSPPPRAIPCFSVVLNDFIIIVIFIPQVVKIPGVKNYKS